MYFSRRSAKMELVALGFLIASLMLSPSLARSASTELKLSGKDSATGESVVRTFTLEQLRELPRAEVSTTTIWTEGTQHFEGVLLIKLWEAAGLSAPKEIRAKALNDYVAIIPAADLETDTVLIADRRNGRDMRVRDKGPLWIIYPSDASAVDYVDKMVWQLIALEAVH